MQLFKIVLIAGTAHASVENIEGNIGARCEFERIYKRKSSLLRSA